MQKMSVDVFIKKLESEITDLPKGKLKGETKFIEYPGLWDSLNVVLFMAFAKIEYNADVETNDIIKAKTVNDLYELIVNKTQV